MQTGFRFLEPYTHLLYIVQHSKNRQLGCADLKLATHLKGFITQRLHGWFVCTCRRYMGGCGGGGPLKISIKHFHKHVRQIFVHGVIMLGSSWAQNNRRVNRQYTRGYARDYIVYIHLVFRMVFAGQRVPI